MEQLRAIPALPSERKWGEVANVSTEFKKLFLRGMVWDSEERGIPLLDSLKAAARSRLRETYAGKFLVSTAANGQQVEYALPSSGDGLTPQSAAEMISELLDRFDAAANSIGAAATDEAIAAEMLSMIQPVVEAYSDFSQVQR